MLANALVQATRLITNTVAAQPYFVEAFEVAAWTERSRLTAAPPSRRLRYMEQIDDLLALAA